MQSFLFRRPGSIEEALSMVEPMGVAGQGGAFLAGGTTVVDLMKLHVLTPPSLTAVAGLLPAGIEVQNGTSFRFGAGTTMAAAADDPACRRIPVLAQSLWKAASPQLRNVAMLGGNVLQRTRCPYFRDTASRCNKREPGSGCAAKGGVNRLLAVLGTSEDCIANYAGDFANALILFDTVVETQGGQGAREIAFADLHIPPSANPAHETTLEDDELIVAFRATVPAWAARSVYVKVRDRESYAFALTSAAVALNLDGDTVHDARIAIGGAATVPWRARQVEQWLKGQTLTEAVAREAGRRAFEGARGWGGNDFKLTLGPNTVARGLMEAKLMTPGAVS